MTDAASLVIVEVNDGKSTTLGQGSLIHPRLVLVHEPVPERFMATDATTARVHVKVGDALIPVLDLHRSLEKLGDVVWALSFADPLPLEPVHLAIKSRSVATNLQVARQHAADGSGLRPGDSPSDGDDPRDPVGGICDWFGRKPPWCR